MGGWRKISRVLSDLGNDARGRDASIGTRSRTSDSSSMRDHDLDAGRTPARGRSCQPRGRSVASVPVAKNGEKTATPAAVPAQKVVRRGRAGNGTRVSIGLTNRTRGPRTGSIRSDVERARSAIARDGRARISTSRAAPVSPVFRGKTEENAEEGWPANGRKPSRELTCVACRLVDVREGTRVSIEGRLEACRLARCRQPRARGAQRSGFRTWRRRRRVKNQNSAGT